METEGGFWAGIDGRRCNFSLPDLGGVRCDIIGVELQIGRVAPVIGLVKSLQGHWSRNVKVTFLPASTRKLPSCAGFKR
jgi:hypothetical protein